MLKKYGITVNKQVIKSANPYKREVILSLYKAKKNLSGKDMSILGISTAMKQMRNELRRRPDMGLVQENLRLGPYGELVQYVGTLRSKDKVAAYKKAMKMLFARKSHDKKRKRQLDRRERFFKDERFFLVGKVHEKGGEILRMYKNRIGKILFEGKKPWTNDTFVSIEIEHISKLGGNALRDLIMEKDAALKRFICIKDDGSIRTTDDYQYGHEIVITARRSEVKDVTTRICRILKLHGAVNKSCGLHVHLDMRQKPRGQYKGDPNEQYETVYKNLVSLNGLFAKVVPKSRLTNDYCKRNRSKDYRATQRGGCRYWMINPQSWVRHKTIEVRVHSATLDEVKVNNWVELLLKIYDLDQPIKRAIATVGGAKKALGLSKELASYFREREKRFQNLDEGEAS